MSVQTKYLTFRGEIIIIGGGGVCGVGEIKKGKLSENCQRSVHEFFWGLENIWRVQHRNCLKDDSSRIHSNISLSTWPDSSRMMTGTHIFKHLKSILMVLHPGPGLHFSQIFYTFRRSTRKLWRNSQTTPQFTIKILPKFQKAIFLLLVLFNP